MNHNFERYPDHPGWDEKINEMDRAERKAEMQIKRHESSYGNDSIFWSMFNDSGERVINQEWFIKMPSDRLTAILVQAQNNLNRIAAERRKHDRESIRYKELTKQWHIQDEKCNFLQACLT